MEARIFDTQLQCKLARFGAKRAGLPNWLARVQLIHVKPAEFNRVRAKKLATEMGEAVATSAAAAVLL